MTVSYRQPGIVLTDRRFTVPLDHDDPSGETIELYAREVVARGKADKVLPWLLYLQGQTAIAPCPQARISGRLSRKIGPLLTTS